MGWQDLENRRSIPLIAKRTRFMRTILSISAAVAIALIALSPSSSQTPLPRLPAVAAARSRQQSVKTINVEFKRIQLYAKGSESEKAPSVVKPKTTVPASDITLESINRLVIDGDKIRYENNHPLWKFPEGT